MGNERKFAGFLFTSGSLWLERLNAKRFLGLGKLGFIG